MPSPRTANKRDMAWLLTWREGELEHGPVVLALDPAHLLLHLTEAVLHL